MREYRDIDCGTTFGTTFGTGNTPSSGLHRHATLESRKWTFPVQKSPDGVECAFSEVCIIGFSEVRLVPSLCGGSSAPDLLGSSANVYPKGATRAFLCRLRILPLPRATNPYILRFVRERLSKWGLRRFKRVCCRWLIAGEAGRVGSPRVGRVVGGNSMRKMVYLATAAVLATIVVAVQRS